MRVFANVPCSLCVAAQTANAAGEALQASLARQEEMPAAVNAAASVYAVTHVVNECGACRNAKRAYVTSTRRRTSMRYVVNVTAALCSSVSPGPQGRRVAAGAGNSEYVGREKISSHVNLFFYREAVLGAAPLTQDSLDVYVMPFHAAADGGVP